MKAVPVFQNIYQRYRLGSQKHQSTEADHGRKYPVDHPDDLLVLHLQQERYAGEEPRHHHKQPPDVGVRVGSIVYCAVSCLSLSDTEQLRINHGRRQSYDVRLG